MNLKLLALAAFLSCDVDDLTECRHDTNCIHLGSKEYLVLTDEEADKATRDYIKDTVWAFNAGFILSECGIPGELEEAIKSFQEKKCEDANEALLALVEKCCKGGVDEFAKSAIRADGRGHFLSSYDGNENEEIIDVPEYGPKTTFYIYRRN